MNRIHRIFDQLLAWQDLRTMMIHLTSNDTWQNAKSVTNSSDQGSEEDLEGYSTDFTSSYDSEDDVWFGVLTGLKDDWQPFSVQGPQDAMKRKGASWKEGRLKGEAVALSSESLQLTKSTVTSRTEDEGINELYVATKPFHTVPTPASASTAGIAPLLEDELKRRAKASDQTPLKRKKAPRGSDTEEYPKPRRNPRRVLNDSESFKGPYLLSPTATITFREALIEKDKPRIVCLSIPPFVVVHVNLAYMAMTGFTSKEVLGLPLQKCLVGESFQKQFPSSVTALQDRLAPIASKRPEVTRCFMKVLLIGPEPLNKPSETDQEEGAGYYVTQYCLQLEPISSGQHLHTISVSP